MIYVQDIFSSLSLAEICLSNELTKGITISASNFELEYSSDMLHKSSDLKITTEDFRLKFFSS